MAASRVYHVDGVQLLVPVQLDALPFTRLEDAPDACGAGRGFGEWVVPEKVLGLRISAACWIHDKDWEFAAPTWDDFHAANGRLLHNMAAIIVAKSKSPLLRVLRIYRPATYFLAVSTAGAKIFRRLKRGQFHDITDLN